MGSSPTLCILEQLSVLFKIVTIINMNNVKWYNLNKDGYIINEHNKIIWPLAEGNIYLHV
jgi:hypothetical protein